MTPEVLERQIPRVHATLKLVGVPSTVHQSSPSRDLYQVREMFSSRQKRTRLTWSKASWGENYSAVWIEEDGVGRRCGEQRWKSKGSAKLGILEK